MAIKILVTGDLHLGKRSSALPAGESKASVRFTWENIVQYVLKHQVDMLLMTGDIVDNNNKYYEAIGALQNGFKELDNAGVTVCLIGGNHDYDVLSQIVSISDISNIHLIGADGSWENKTFTINEETVRVTGWSFPRRYIDADSTAEFKALSNDDGILTLAMLHGDIYLGTSRYNPLQLEKLKNIPGVDAWLLGHIHRPNVLNEVAPLVLYPGSPHALSPKEQGIHGPYLLTVENRMIETRQIPLSPVYYDTVEIDISAIADEATFRSTTITSMRTHISGILGNSDPDFLVFDIQFTGTCNNPSELRKWGDNIRNYDLDNQCNINIRTIEYNLRPQLDIDHLLDDPSYIGVLATAIKALKSGTSNKFTNKLIQDWKSRFRQITSLPVFSPLYVDINDAELEAMAREYVLSECMEIISELNNQRNEN